MIDFWNMFYKFAGNLILSVTDEYEKRTRNVKITQAKNIEAVIRETNIPY